MARHQYSDSSGNQAIKIILIVFGSIFAGVTLVCGGCAFVVYRGVSQVMVEAKKAVEKARLEQEAEVLEWEAKEKRLAAEEEREQRELLNGGPTAMPLETRGPVASEPVTREPQSPFQPVSPEVEAITSRPVVESAAGDESPFQVVPSVPAMETDPFSPVVSPAPASTAQAPLTVNPAPAASREPGAATRLEEAVAEKQFKMAEKFAKFKDLEPYRKRLRDIVERWPGTKAAQEAALILKAEVQDE